MQLYTDRNEDVFQVEAGWGVDERDFVAAQLVRNREAIDVQSDRSRFLLVCLWVGLIRFRRQTIYGAESSPAPLP